MTSAIEDQPPRPRCTAKAVNRGGGTIDEVNADATSLLPQQPQETQPPSWIRNRKTTAFPLMRVLQEPKANSQTANDQNPQNALTRDYKNCGPSWFRTSDKIILNKVIRW